MKQPLTTHEVHHLLSKINMWKAAGHTQRVKELRKELVAHREATRLARQA